MLEDPEAELWRGGCGDGGVRLPSCRDWPGIEGRGPHSGCTGQGNQSLGFLRRSQPWSVDGENLCYLSLQSLFLVTSAPHAPSLQRRSTDS